MSLIILRFDNYLGLLPSISSAKSRVFSHAGGIFFNPVHWQKIRATKSGLFLK